MQQYVNRKKYRGMTLVEVMVAMTIGLILTLMMVTLFVGQHRGYQQNEATARMQENGRFTLELITQDLRHAGFFGEVSSTDIQVIGGLTTTVDCLGGTAKLFDFSQLRYIIGYADRFTAAVGTGCLSAGDIDTTNGSSILIVKRSAATPTADADLVNGLIYTYARGGRGQLYQSDGTNLATVTDGENWHFQPRIYYVDNEDTLHRKTLNSAGAFVSEPVAEGIEAFHIEFGIDPDGNGIPDFFYTPAAGTFTDGTLNEAVSATIYVLARTTRRDHDADYTDDRDYNLGGITLGPFNDKFHRRVFSTTTALKNIRTQIMLQQGS